MKKIISLLISIIMILSCVSIGISSSFALSQFDYYWYNHLGGAVKNGVVIDHVVYCYVEATKNEEAHYTVNGYYDSEEAMNTMTQINIVDDIDGIPVTEIYVGHIDSTGGYYVSAVDAPNVTKIKFSKNLKRMMYGTFSCLPNLEKYVIPEGVTYINGIAWNLETIKAITIPQSVETAIEPFMNCKNLEKAVIKANLTYISANAFKGCEKLKSIRIPETVKNIGQCAFYNCKSLERVVFEQNNTNKITIGRSAFRNCKSLEKVYLPKQAKSVTLDSYAFKGCTNLTAISNSDKIVSFGLECFNNCSSLKSITIAKNVKIVCNDSFKKCDSLKKVKLLTTNTEQIKTANYKNILARLKKDCKIYVKTSKMKAAVQSSGFKGKITVK